ncbi:MAG: nucleotidyltransferase domain-containing protein [Deltaproteobacteria bacterium]|nr:nucleotidyltransferase domain-containing protein [Deltaproteobacteria bacterium]
MDAAITSYVDGWRRRAAAEERRQTREREATLARLAPLARELKERFGARRVVLFGSRAAGSADPGSDVDIAVEGLPAERYADALLMLERALGRECVDLVEYEDAGNALRAKIDAGVTLDE